MPEPEPEPPTAAYFYAPVGTEAERVRYPPGVWYVSLGYGVRYQIAGSSSYSIHTGDDLNLPGGTEADLGQPVYAPGNGVTTYSALVPTGSWGNVVVVLVGGVHFRAGHLGERMVSAGQAVTRLTQIGTVGRMPLPYGQAPHLHWDVSESGKLADDPLYWPGDDMAAVLAHFTDPKTFFLAHRPPDLPVIQIGDPGVDVSRHQGKIDHGLLVGTGLVKFAMVRVCTGTLIDERFRENWAGFKGRVPRMPYIYYIPTDPPEPQFEAFRSFLADDPGEENPILDAEPRAGEVIADRVRLENWYHDWLYLCQDWRGLVPDIYTAKWAWPLVTTSPVWSQEYGLAVASYGTEAAFDLPFPWTLQQTKYRQWTDRGQLAGTESTFIDRQIALFGTLVKP